MSEYIFNINPIPKIRMVASDKWKKRPAVLRYWAYKDELVKQAKELNYTIPDVLENVTFQIEMPASWSQKKRVLMDGKPHQQTPDLDNLIKSFLDCLASEDKQIHTFKNISKVWGLTGQIIIHE